MDKETKQQMESDIVLSKTMSDINASVEILDLTNRLISYLDLISTAIARCEYEMGELKERSVKLKGKKKVLEQYVMTSKNRHKELSILEYEIRKGKS